MREFILGFPKGKEPIEGNIALYETRQSAGSATEHFLIVETDSLDKAKTKFMELAARDFMPN